MQINISVYFINRRIAEESAIYNLARAILVLTAVFLSFITTVILRMKMSENSFPNLNRF